MEKTKKAPNRLYYAIGGAALVVGFVGFVIFVVFLITRLASAMPSTRIVVPGSENIGFDEPGKYTVYYEYRSVIDNKIYSTGETMPANVTVTLISEKDLQTISIMKPSTNETYESGGYTGVSVFAFEILTPGAYIFTANYDNGVNKPEIVFAIGQSRLLGTIFSGLGIFFASFILFVIGGVIILVTFLKSRGIRK